jgi:threonine synthase
MCVELGIKKVAIPSAGQRGSAMAAYAAAAGIEAHIFMPRDVPQANFIECCAAGANVTLVDGLISDCGKIVASRKDAEGWFDISTLKEPYRIEGKKTMGYEVAEQFRLGIAGRDFLPGCGGGVGMIGMWKAFEPRWKEMGWIGSKRPKMIAVQAAGCAPIVALSKKAKRSDFFENAEHRRQRPARAQAARRFSGVERRARKRRHGHRGQQLAGVIAVDVIGVLENVAGEHGDHVGIARDPAR